MAFLRYCAGTLILMPLIVRIGPDPAPLALWFWQAPYWTDLLWFLAAGLCGTLGHICQQRGYQIAEITLLQPIGFLSLIWNTLLGFFLFSQQPDVWTFVGAAVIFASA